MVEEHGPQHIPMKAIYYPDAIYIKSVKVFAFYHFILHFIPAVLGDVVLQILGKKPM